MARASTKSRTPAKTGREPKGSAASSSFDVSAQGSSSETGDLSVRIWRIASLLILGIASLLRVYKLTLKPLHHDEGVNGFFLTRLVRDGFYQYDPGNYHGPTLYYFALITSRLFGLNTISIRIITVVFGVATVWLALCLRRYIGTVGALTAAGLIAISPGAVYLSRYFIHETLVVFFTFGIVVAALKYSERDPPENESKASGLLAVVAGILMVASALGAVYKPQIFRIELLLMMVGFIVVVQSVWHYDGSRSVYFILAAISAALLFASKETALVSVSVLVIALIVATVYLRLKKKPEVGSRKKKREGKNRKARREEGWLHLIISQFGGPAHFGLMLFVAVTIFVFVNVLFYSSFFTNAKGVSDSLQTFVFWARTGKQEHVHPWYQHSYWLLLKESPTLLLGIMGAYLAVVRPNNRFALFAALWGFGLLVAYSIVPYKTPWLALNFIVPIAIAGGFAANEIYDWSRGEDQAFLASVLVVALAVSGYQTIQLNFIHYDDDRYVYVYGHTYREFLPLVDDIKEFGRKTHLNEKLDVAVLSPDYWPLPWYMRDYPGMGYYGQPSPTNSSLVIINESQEAELLPTLEIRYQRIGSYPLRPGVVLVLYARRDLNTD